MACWRGRRIADASSLQNYWCGVHVHARKALCGPFARYSSRQVGRKCESSLTLPILAPHHRPRSSPLPSSPLIFFANRPKQFVDIIYAFLGVATAHSVWVKSRQLGFGLWSIVSLVSSGLDVFYFALLASKHGFSKVWCVPSPSAGSPTHRTLAARSSSPTP